MKTPPAWTQALLQNLAQVDGAAASYLQTRRVKIGFNKQSSSTAAIWTPGRRIYLNAKYFSPETPPDDPRVLSLLIHEVRHLQQGFFTALSVYGELEAWQLGFRVEKALTGRTHPPVIEEMLTLPLNRDREVLEHARRLMLAYAGPGYRADLLPLYPLGQEIRYWVKKLTGLGRKDTLERQPEDKGDVR
jgi:hypothetical protein